ncbi:MAG: LCP family protein [Microbacteriaceae bacterium]|nr:LCP family protein [Microbacteriaceae bacterium]
MSAPEPEAAAEPEVQLTRRELRKGELSSRRVMRLAPVAQLLPGLAQLLLKQRLIGILGLVSSALGLAGLVTLILAFVIDRRIGLSWVTQERPLTIIVIVSLVLGLAWLCLGIHLAVKVIRQKSRGSSRIWIAALVMLVTLAQTLVTGGIAYYSNLQRDFVSKLFPESGNSSGFVDDALNIPMPPPKEPILSGRVDILILGGDAGEGRWGLRPDSISVFSIDLNTGKTTIIGVPRNMQRVPFVSGSPLWGPFPDGYSCGPSCLISYLYTYASGRPGLYPDSPQPGVEATRDAVEGVLGIDIPYAVLIDMQAFEEMIDAIGGIDMCIPKDVLSDNGQKVIVSAGCSTMDGETALAYARARHDSDDYNRMTKQRAIQEALIAQADPFVVLQNFQKLTAAGSKYVYTDIPQGGLGALIDALIRSRGQKVQTLEIVPPNFSSIHPPIQKIHDAVQAALSK